MTHHASNLGWAPIGESNIQNRSEPDPGLRRDGSPWVKESISTLTPSKHCPSVSLLPSFHWFPAVRAHSAGYAGLRGPGAHRSRIPPCRWRVQYSGGWPALPGLEGKRDNGSKEEIILDPTLSCYPHQSIMLECKCPVQLSNT